jgi:ketosteroid isomerase-like protein
MSAENVELARRGYEAVTRGDFELIGEMLADDVKWHGGDEFAEGACRNRAQALRFMQAGIEQGRLGELVDVIDACGDRVVVVIRPPGEDSPRANVTTFRDGKVVEMVAYESPEEALAAVGVSRP